MASVPSPVSNPPIQAKDSDVGYSFVEFPEDVFFMESLAANDAFRPGVAYVPVQRFVNNQEESHLYEFTPSSKEAKHIAGPIAAPDGSIDVTIFGSALSSTGILYMTAFNRNSVLSFDLSKLPERVEKLVCTKEVGGLPSPNDVCLDPKDESVMYVVGGIFSYFLWYKFSNSAFGRVYKVQMNQDDKKTIVAEGLRTLAGVEVSNTGNLWIAQLYDMLTQESPAEKKAPSVVWEGLNAQDEFWLADNISLFDENFILCPAYSTIAKRSVDIVMRRPWLTSAVLFYYQVSTAFMRGESLRVALRDPEVSLSFSNTYIDKDVAPAPLRILFLDDTDTSKAYHFEVDLEETRAQNPPRDVLARDGKEVLGQRHFFNEQVTHAHQLKDLETGTGVVACVNFEQPRIMLLKDDYFRNAMAN